MRVTEPRTARLGRGRMTYYPAALRQAAHAHDDAHVSVLLAGALLETHGTCENVVAAGGAAWRPSGFRHAVSFGSEGALVLALPAREASTVAGVGGGWTRPLDLRLARRLVRGALDSVEEPAAEDLLYDVLAAAPDTTSPRPAPRWLAAARERLTEEPGTCRIGDLARESGRHRVAFSRAFRARYGLLPSEYRHRAMLGRAVAGLIGGGAPAEVAVATGFADQSHLCRSTAAALGLTPARLRAMLA